MQKQQATTSTMPPYNHQVPSQPFVCIDIDTLVVENTLKLSSGDNCVGLEGIGNLRYLVFISISIYFSRPLERPVKNAARNN